jgi:molybdopterin-containing oxidoreductase family iron-sulfur binding subunit
VLLTSDVKVGGTQSLSLLRLIAVLLRPLSQSKAAAGFELVLYTKQEWVTVNRLIILGYKFPDPITRVSWDNYVTVSNADAKN